MGPCNVAVMGGKDGWLYAFDARTGKKGWSTVYTGTLSPLQRCWTVCQPRIPEQKFKKMLQIDDRSNPCSVIRSNKCLSAFLSAAEINRFDRRNFSKAASDFGDNSLMVLAETAIGSGFLEIR